jgi:hypothetical protein
MASADSEVGRVSKAFDCLERLFKIWNRLKNCTDVILVDATAGSGAVQTGVPPAGDRSIPVGGNGWHSKCQN